MHKCSRSCRKMVRTFPTSVSFSRSRQSNVLTFALWTGHNCRPSDCRQPVLARFVVQKCRSNPTCGKAQSKCHPVDALNIACGQFSFHEMVVTRISSTLKGLRYSQKLRRNQKGLPLRTRPMKLLTPSERSVLGGPCLGHDLLYWLETDIRDIPRGPKS